MVDIDPITGLPKELLAFEEIAKEQQRALISTVRRRYGKMVLPSTLMTLLRP